jgi:hypothetical protein
LMTPIEVPPFNSFRWACPRKQGHGHCQLPSEKIKVTSD